MFSWKYLHAFIWLTWLRLFEIVPGFWVRRLCVSPLICHFYFVCLAVDACFPPKKIPRKFFFPRKRVSAGSAKISWNYLFILVHRSVLLQLLPHLVKYGYNLLLMKFWKCQSESTYYSLPECQETPCSKQTPYLNFKWQ